MNIIRKVYDVGEPDRVWLVSHDETEAYAEYMPRLIRLADELGITDEGRCVEFVGCCGFGDNKVICI